MADSPSVDARHGLDPVERRAVISLIGIYVLRMMGLFMVLPVFVLYADDYGGSTPMLIGLAIGAYGLTQALFQIPFGLLSDRFGRKPLIVLGLALFAAGSIIAALSTSIVGIIIGRVIQGAGAVASVILALAADLTREQERLKVMAMIGASIGVAFAVAIVISPPLTAALGGLSGLFWLTAVLALGSIAIVVFAVPTPPRGRVHRDTQAVPALIGQVMRDPRLLRMDLGVFTLHALLTSNYVALPLLLVEAGVGPAVHGAVYLGVFAVSLGVAIPALVMAQRRAAMVRVAVLSMAVMALGQVVFIAGGLNWVALTLGLVLFFAAFNALEALLPSLVSRIAPADGKGTALGLYSSAQFLGAFAGGVGGGVLYGAFGAPALFGFGLCLALIWVGLSAQLAEPKALANYVLRVGLLPPSEVEAVHRRLTAIAGVEDAVVAAEEGVAYLKVDRRSLDEGALARVVTRPA